MGLGDIYASGKQSFIGLLLVALATVVHELNCSLPFICLSHHHLCHIQRRSILSSPTLSSSLWSTEMAYQGVLGHELGHCGESLLTSGIPSVAPVGQGSVVTSDTPLY